MIIFFFCDLEAGNKFKEMIFKEKKFQFDHFLRSIIFFIKKHKKKT